MLKKFMSAFIALTIAFSAAPATGIFHDDSTTVSAKYRSGKRSFNPSPSYKKPSQQQKSNFQRKSPAAKVNKPRTGGFMRGMLFGGLAGFLLGGMLNNFGFLGGLIGLFINIIAVLVVIALIRKIVGLLFGKKRRDENTWRR